jgi:hypothetical protein
MTVFLIAARRVAGFRVAHDRQITSCLGFVFQDN